MRNTNAYTEYDYNNFSYYYPISFEKENRCYLQNRYKPNFRWNYGDPIHLEFCVSLYDDSSADWQDINSVDISEMVENGFEAEFGTMFDNPYSTIPFLDIINASYNKKFLVEFYNNRFENIYAIERSYNEILELNIDSNISKKLFYKGIFHCSIKLLDEDSSLIETILNSRDCSLYVM